MRTGQEITIRFAGESQPKVLRIPEAVQAGMAKVPKDIQLPPTLSPPTSPPKKLRVRFSDGTQLYDTQSVRTFIRTIEKIGSERVFRLQIPMSGGHLVSTQPGPREEFWKPLSGGFHINTNSANATKKMQLERIRADLRENFQVELV